MIPQKLYIPTSTLNFNNIMSSESISPISFYKKRSFGYRRFESVLPNRLENRLLLYAEYPIFSIKDEGVENYPLVIEIDTRYVPFDVIKETQGFYYADSTIYINPFTTKLIFRKDGKNG